MGLKDHDLAVLLQDFPDHGLHAGDVGTVVHAYGDGGAYEVEFVDLAGDTLAVVTIEGPALRALRPDERPIPHLQHL